MPETLSAKEAAAELGTDARTLRKFLRSNSQDVVSPVGQGKRYALTKGDIKKLRKKFDQWSEGKAPKEEKGEEPEEVEEDEVMEIDDEDLDDLEPDDDEIEEIELEDLD